MQPIVYDLPIGSPSLARTARSWLLLGILSLLGAGFFSVLLVLARTPVVQELIPLVDFFHTALVIHVNLSVLIWLLSMAGVWWSLACTLDSPVWDRISLGLALTGTGIVVISPFVGADHPLMNNYVPLLRHPVFFVGLALFTAGISSHLLRCAVGSARNHANAGDGLGGTDALRTGIRLAAVITGVAVLAFIASLLRMPPDIHGELYFEFLFWGGGHVLQFTHTLLMMVAWVLLASASGCRLPVSARTVRNLLALLALPIIAVPFFYLNHAVDSPGQRLAFTSLMKYGGLSCLPIGFVVLASLWQSPAPTGESRYLRSALCSSLVLFATGGVLGFLIAGLDIIIPAHYHGSTVGVTIAFMGACFYLMPRLGFGPIPPRLAFWQPIVYASGQLMHIAGLAWSGGYGVQRKTVDLALGVDHLGEMAGMGLMGLGGLVSVVGGILFLVIAWQSIRRRPSK